MAESIEDLNLPTAIVQRLIKEGLPAEDQNTLVSKDVRLAIGKATSLFILHLTTQALTNATEKNRRTLTPVDVMKAVGDLGFDPLLEPLHEQLEELKKKTKRRSSSGKKDNSKNVSNIEEMEIEDEDNEAEEEDDEDVEK